MRYEDMVDQVRQRAALPSDAAAEQILTGTLAVLGERIGAGAGNSVASQLPEQLATFLRREAADVDSPDEAFGAEEFVQRVGAKAGASGDVESMVVATLGVISKASGGALDDLREELPPDYEPLFLEVQGAPGSL